MSLLFVKLSLPSRINLISKLRERVPIRTISSTTPNDMMESIHTAINAVRRREGLKSGYEILRTFKMFAITSYHNLYYHQDPRCQPCDCTEAELEQLEECEIRDFNESPPIEEDNAPISVNEDCSVSPNKTRKNKKKKKRRPIVTVDVPIDHDTVTQTSVTKEEDTSLIPARSVSLETLNHLVIPDLSDVLDASASVRTVHISEQQMCDRVQDLDDVVQCFVDTTMCIDNDLNVDSSSPSGSHHLIEPFPIATPVNNLGSSRSFQNIVRRMIRNLLPKLIPPSINNLLLSSFLTNTKMRKLSNYVYRASRNKTVLRARFIYLAVKVGYQTADSN